jgi:BON domain
MYALRNLSTSRAILAAAALTIAFGFAGCKSSSPAPTDDAGLTAALQSRIAADAALSNEPIQSSVQKQVATLNGTVSNEAARSLAAADAAQVAGIKTVINNLTVQAPAPAVTAAAAPPPSLPQPLPEPPAPVAPKPKQPATVKQKSAPIIRQTAPVEPPSPQAAEVAPPPPAQQEPPPPLPPPPPPAFRNITLNPGTTIPIRITQTLDSATTQQGETFTGTVAADIVTDGVVVIRTGTPVTGRVIAVQEAAHYKGSSLLTVELTSINRRSEKVTVNTEPYSVQGKGRGKNTAEKVGGGAAVGAILGGILGGGKGAAIGAAAGGGVGAGANTITRGEQVQIPSETLIRFNLTNTLSLRVPTSGETENPAPNPTLQQHPPNQPQQ